MHNLIQQARTRPLYSCSLHHPICLLFFFFLMDPAPPEISPLPLHAALPISARVRIHLARRRRRLLHSGTANSSCASRSASAIPSTTVIRPFSMVKRNTSDSRPRGATTRSEEHTSELQSQSNLVCRLLLEKKK